MILKSGYINNPVQNRDAARRAENLAVGQHRKTPPFSLMEFLRLLIFALFLLQSATAATLTAGYSPASGLLGGKLFIDNAATGGGDSSSSTGNLGWTAELAGLWSSNSTVILSGIALPIWSDANDTNTTVSGTFTFYFYDLDKGANPNAFDGIGEETLLGTAAAGFTQGAVGTYYAVFDSPIRFTARSTGVAVRIVNTGWLRLKVCPAVNAPGVVLKNSSTGVAIGGSNPNFRITLAGLAFTPTPSPSRFNLAKYQPVSTDSTNGTQNSAGLTAGFVNDNNCWVSSSNGAHWAQVTLPFPVTVGSAQLAMGLNNASPMTVFYFQYLTNGDWATVSGSTIAGNTNVERNVVFSSPVTSTAFRVYDSLDSPIRIRQLALYPPDGMNGYPFGTDFSIDLARKQPAFATANAYGHWPLLAADGLVDPSSAWQTTQVGSNALLINLQFTNKIGSAHLYSGATGVPPLTNFVLQYWTGGAWANIPGGSVAGNTSGALVIPFTTPVTTTKVQLVFTNATVSAVRELCVFPANSNGGYPLGTGIVSNPPVTAKYDTYSDSYYYLGNSAAGSVIVESNGLPVPGRAVQTNSWSQYQVLLNYDTGTYRLINRASGLCLAGAQMRTNPGAALVDEGYSALPDQDWYLQPVDGTNFYLVNQFSGLVLDMQGGALVQNVQSNSTSQFWQIALAQTFPKKGIAGSWGGYPVLFHANWTYSWWYGSDPNIAGVNYFPMDPDNWYRGSTVSGNLWSFQPGWRKLGYSLNVLGYNEPDQVDQANLDATNGAIFWMNDQNLDLPLAGPAAANVNGTWNQVFYGYITNWGCRVDYLPAHEYPGNSSSASSSIWVNPLQTAYNTYGIPLWMTEWSVVDWSGTGNWSEEDNYNALAEFLWRAESIPWLRKYSLFIFTADTNSPMAINPWTRTTPAPRSNSYDTNGILTPFGELYAAWDDDANVESNKAYFIHNNNTRKRLANNLNPALAAASSICTNDATVQWVLTPVGNSGLYYLISQLDGRRLSFTNGGSVSLAAPGTIGSAVQWGLTPYQYGWFYLEHPATKKRLQLADTNSTQTATFSMVTNTTTGNPILWRFIVPLNPVDVSILSPPAGLVATGGIDQATLKWSASPATDVLYYSVYRSPVPDSGYSLLAANLTTTNYLDAGADGGATYYYVVTATDWMGRESAYSLPAAAVSLPPLPAAPTNIVFRATTSNLVLNWPKNYTGWILQAQTNSLLGVWFNVPGSAATNLMVVPITPDSPSVFFRMIYP